MTDETRPAPADAAAFDRRGQDAVEGRKPGTAGGEPDAPPPAPAPTVPTMPDTATPGAGALPSGGDQQGEVDPAVG